MEDFKRALIGDFHGRVSPIEEKIREERKDTISGLFFFKVVEEIIDIIRVEIEIVPLMLNKVGIISNRSS